MKVTVETDQLVVYDDVLEHGELERLWLYVQGVELRPVDVGTPTSPWLLSDGRPMQGPGAVAWIDLEAAAGDRTTRYPTNTPLDLVLERLMNDHGRFARWLGPAIHEWSAVTAAPWVYASGSALAWHTDGAMYSGAFTFYVHPQWDPHWGGELVVAHESARHQRELVVDGAGAPMEDRDQRFSRSRMAARVAEIGVGTHILPRPNRLVIVAGGHPHKVARVDATAGLNVRASIAGFFVRRAALATLRRS